MKNHICLFATFFTLSVCSYAQKIGDIYPKGIDVIEGGIKLYDEDKYDLALVEYKKVNECDSNYYYALYETALSLMQLKKYDSAIVCCKKGLLLNSVEERGFFDLLGSSFDYLGMQDSAIHYYKKGISKFPYYHKYYFEIAVSYIGSGNDSLALPYLIKANSLNSFHAGTHLHLAQLAQRNGFYTAAILAYEFFLVLENQTSRALNAMTSLEKLCNNNFEIVKIPYLINVGGQNNFAELDEVVKSRAAQIESYKSKVKIQYTDITKQCQIISEKYKFDPNDKGFYSQFYGSFWSKVWEKELFEGSMYAIFSGINNEKIQDLVKKNQSKINAFVDFAAATINDYRKNTKHQVNGTEVDGQRFFYKNGTLESVGLFDAKGKRTGKWYIYHATGFLASVGEYKNDFPDGRWQGFYENGNKRSEVNWANSKRNGSYTLYHNNGMVKEKGMYVNDELEGILLSYFSNGSKRDESSFKNKVQNGDYFVYTNQEVKSAQAVYENGKLNGKVINYFKNGNLSEERMFKNGLCEGPSKSQYISGEQEFKGAYASDKKTGMWEWYYKNGNKSKEGEYANGNQIKKWTEYYEDGAVKEICNYNSDGDLDGDFISFNHRGKILQEGKFKAAKLVAMTYYNENKEVVYNYKNSSDDYEIKKYYSNGNLQEDGKMVKKLRNGVFTRYYTNGAKSQEITYKDGKFEGLYTKYFVNGNKEEEFMCRNDEFDGYFRKYYSDGKLKVEGYYERGKLTGPNIEYYNTGALKNKYYYMNGEDVGYSEYYDAKGRINWRSNLSDVIVSSQVFYDTLGKPIQTIDFKNGTGTYAVYGLNKQKLREFGKLFGRYHGKHTKYHFNGQVKEVAEYYYNDLNGKVITKGHDGKVLSEKNYVYDLEEGAHTFYNSNGTIEFIENWSNGEVNGFVTWYHSNGKVFSKHKCVNNEIDSAYTFYGEDGTLALQLFFDHGVLNGYTYLDKMYKLLPVMGIKSETADIEAYYPNGKKSAELHFVKGSYQGKKIIYFTNGQKFMDVDYVDGLYNGVYKEYHVNGKLKEDRIYQNGNLNGLTKIYYENGNLERETWYVNDIRYGGENIYDATGKIIYKLININGESYKR